MKKFYTEYGKFIIHFEAICFRLNYIIRKICTKGNLFGEEDRKIEILLQGLTAQPILTKFYSLFMTIDLSKNIELLTMTKKFNTEFVKVIEYRNLLAHGTFFYGDAHGDTDKFQVRNPKLNKKGFNDNTSTISITSLRKLNADMLNLKAFIDCLSFYMKQYPKKSSENLWVVMTKSISNINVELKIDVKSIQL